uniref:Tryptophan--tRNA ligase n=1 Tax=Candidatus Aschnera chinzeii TaxID=1485666 RepID=A0AAT9G5C9_9ENTR|nr:MAG: tryptophan--tRNA ligase [Candidatus Aschnera chinzeii]
MNINEMHIVSDIKKKPIVFSAIQPSGTITIGNYVGAVRQWINMQHKFDCIYCIVDQHAMTIRPKPSELKKNILDILALFLACGIDYNKCIIFIQSHVPQHSQLSWILNCYTYYGELKRMIQFKNHLLKNNYNINVGLMNYPILMIADILLYQTNIVPVGIDQKQHLELCRTVARRFNSIYKQDIFTIPQCFFVDSGNLVMSLQKPQEKMSKSDINKNNLISLLEDPSWAAKKIKKACTDSNNPPKIIFDTVNKPGISNLIYILSGITNMSIGDIEDKFVDNKYDDFKNIVAEAVSIKLHNIQEKFFEFRRNEKLLFQIISEGALQASNRAQQTLIKLYDIIGFV